jgi:hypothetical protein
MSHVGIFFLIGDSLMIEGTPLDEAEPYGAFLGFAGGHSEMFDHLVELKKVPANEEYQNVPRGRVVYAVAKGEYIVYLDPCIRRRPETVSQIVERLHLPPDRYKLASDAHYRCAACMRRVTKK